MDPAPKTSPAADTPLAGIHTVSFANLLEQLQISIAVTTYQAGKLVILRPQRRHGNPVVDTHFQAFRRPMGFAWEPGRFALGTVCEIREFHDLPDPPPRSGEPFPPDRNDAWYLPRLVHTTGDIQVHEMLWVPATTSADSSGALLPSELWFVNTRFSCLATRDEQFSFVPRWKPPFITELTAEDRCHLNGMCLRDGAPRYVTALGASDTLSGWRANKHAGGIVIDVLTGETIARGLSMPHSPRWHDGKLWLLESGNGGLGVVDLQTGKYTQRCRLPGFTRGLDFAGPFALVGLSKVRDAANFSGINIAGMPEPERYCGIWAVDTRTDQIVGFMKFTNAVQEIFAVQVLSGLCRPGVFSEDVTRIAATFRIPGLSSTAAQPNVTRAQ